VNGGTTGPSTATYGGAADAGSVELTGGTHFLGNATFAGGVTVTGATVQVTAGQTTNVSGANALGSGTINGTGTFNLTSGVFSWGGGSFDGAGTTRVAPGATLRRTGANSVFVANSRQVEVEGTLDLSEPQTIFSSGTPGQIHVAPGGTMQRTTTTGVATVNAPVDNDGTVEALTGVLDINGTLANYNASTDTLTGGTFAARGAEIELPGVVQVNSSTLVLEGSTALMSTGGQNALAGLDLQGGLGTLEMESNASLTLDGSLTNAGTVRLSDSAALETTGNYTQSGGVTQLVSPATLLTAAGATVDIFGGRLEGVGTVTPALVNEAEVRPGSSPGILTVSGSYTQTSDGTLRTEVGGTTPGTQYDRLVVTGPATLAGTLAGDTISGFAPALGQSFQVVTCGPCSGTFGSVTSTGLPSGRTYAASQTGSATSLVVVAGGPPPDTTPPDTAITAGPSGSTDDSTPTFEFNATESGSTFECSVDGGAFAPCSSPFTTPDLPAGSHTFSVRARDAAGNVGPASTSSFTVAAKKIEDLPVPTLGEEVNVGPVPGSGPVLIAVPAGATAAARAHASQKGLTFVPLTEARQIPTGSFLDTRRGTVEMQSATGQAQRVQSGKFSAGIFQVLQSRARRARGLTELRLKGGSFRRCGGRASRSGSSATAALSRRAVRRLRANVRGRFSTRGNNSSATVRGTVWTTTDRCDGTLTQVKRGTVVVRDFRRKRNVILRAGKSYLARAKG
jgi:hypothetical protein